MTRQLRFKHLHVRNFKTQNVKVSFLPVFPYWHHYQSNNTTTETLITEVMIYPRGHTSSIDIDPVIIILIIPSYPSFRVPDARTCLLKAFSGALRPDLLDENG